MATQLDRSAYTVGWICALHIEYTAAQEFLDEEHVPLEDDPNQVRDDNHYTLGAIGKHNVVIAVLPSGEYGTASAASVAKDLVRSFPNVRIGLMVGIGGGAPSDDNDIRLGDIVVSTAGDGHSGVFQYDFGKTIQDRKFQHTRIMDQPPAVLRAAVSGLRSRYERKGHAIDTAIEDVLAGNKRLRKKYGKPEPSADLLFKSDCLHQGVNCDNVCAKDTSNLVDRAPRDEDEGDMQIHYGLIASANSLMKDALVRDQLIEDKNVLCFEMEAAGLMNSFPCLVIRGICDYADSHKSKVWQGYAAMAAAAYAKALCLEIKATSIEKERKVLDVVSEVRDATVATNAGVSQIRSNLEADEDRRILDWLSTDDYGAQHSDVLNNRSEGTGKWLLNSKEYQDWLSGSRPTLFCPGIPGAGKTVITSTVINDLMCRFNDDKKIAIAFIYCNFRRQDSQSLDKLLSSLLRQLCSHLSFVPDLVRKLFDKHKLKSTRPSKADLKGTLRKILDSFEIIFIVIDAFDECQSSDGNRSSLPDTIFGFQQEANVNFFATSRHLPEIEDKFKGMPCLEIAATSDDLTTYMQENVSKLPEFVRQSESLQDEILDHVIQASQGMFLVARLYVQSLIDKHSVRSLREALSKLHGADNSTSDQNRSHVLHTAYSDIFERIRGQLPGFRELAERVLIWVAFTKQRFTAEVLKAFVATRVGERRFDRDNVTNIDILISVCCGLVTLEPESNAVQLVHYTTQDYLEEHKEKLFPRAFSIIANDCMTHLMYDLTEKELILGSDGVSLTGHKFIHGGYGGIHRDEEAFVEMHLLRIYSSYYWGHHVMMAESSEGPVDAVDTFFKDDEKVLAAAVRLFRSPLVSKVAIGFGIIGQRTSFCLTPRLHLAAFWGLVDRVRPLVKMNPEAVNSQFIFELHGGEEWSFPAKPTLHLLSPLHLAILASQMEVIELLLDLGADLHSSNPALFSPLAFACDLGNYEVADLLLRKGANVNEVDGICHYSPLHCALRARDNTLELVGLLITHGADINATDSAGESVLLKSVYQCPTDVITCLVKSGADLASKDRFGRTALILAAAGGDTDTTKLLAQHGCNVDCTDYEMHTALYYALQRGHTETARILLEADAHLGIEGDKDFDPLETACCEGNTELMNIMIEFHSERLVDIFLKEEWQGRWLPSPVELAAMNGHEDVVQLLLDTTPERPAKTEWRHIMSVAACMQVDQPRCARIIAFYLADDPEQELMSLVFHCIAVQPSFVSEPEILENLIRFDPEILSRDNNGDKGLVLAAKELRRRFLSKRIPGGTEYAMQTTKIEMLAYRTTERLLREGANPYFRGLEGWTAQEYSEKCNGDDMSAFIESLGIDPFHWHVVSQDGLTWYSGMLVDYTDTGKHMADWQEDFTETFAYHERFGDDPFTEWFVVVPAEAKAA